MMTTENTFVEAEAQAVEPRVSPGYLVDEASLTDAKIVYTDSKLPEQDESWIERNIRNFKETIPYLTVKQLTDFGIEVVPEPRMFPDSRVYYRVSLTV